MPRTVLKVYCVGSSNAPPTVLVSFPAYPIPVYGAGLPGSTRSTEDKLLPMWLVEARGSKGLMYMLVINRLSTRPVVCCYYSIC